MIQKICLRYNINNVYIHPFINVSDADINSIQTACFPEEPWGVNNVKKINAIAYVLYNHETPIGMFCISPLTGYVQYLSSFCIIPKYRRKGIGRKLYKFVHNMSIAQNVDTLFDSDVNNNSATTFYKSVGSKMIDTTQKSHIWLVK